MHTWCKIVLCAFLLSAFMGTANSRTTTKPENFETEDGSYFTVICEGGRHDAKYLQGSLKELREYIHLIQETLLAEKRRSVLEKTFVEIRVVDPQRFARLLHSVDAERKAEDVAVLILEDTVFLKSFLKADDAGFKSALAGYVFVSYFRLHGRFPSSEETDRLVSAADEKVAYRKYTVSVKELASR